MVERGGRGREWSDPANWLFVVAIFVALVALHFVLLAPVSNRWTVRPLLTVIVIASAATAYFMRTYAVMMDPTMIQNILKTDTHEAKELMSWSMVGSVLLWSALPVAFIWWVRIEHGPWLRSVLVRAGAMAGALVVAVAVDPAGLARFHLADAQSARDPLPDHARQLPLRTRQQARRAVHGTRMRRANPWAPMRG